MFTPFFNNREFLGDYLVLGILVFGILIDSKVLLPFDCRGACFQIYRGIALVEYLLLLYIMARAPPVFATVDEEDIDFEVETPFDDGILTCIEGRALNGVVDGLAPAAKANWKEYFRPASMVWHRSLDHTSPFSQKDWEALSEEDKLRGLEISVFGWHRRLWREDATRLLGHLGQARPRDTQIHELGGSRQWNCG